MPLLVDSDYTSLQHTGLEIAEDLQQRFLIFRGVDLPPGQYTVAKCDVLVGIPANYPQAGNDMFWTYPRLQRADGRAIPASLDPGGGDNRIWQGREFCRWSRHWDSSSSAGWRPGKDDVISIYRRVEWALMYPDGQ